GLPATKFWDELTTHRCVIVVAKAVADDQRAAFGLAQRILEFVALVRWIDVDQNRADLRRGELNDRPLGAIGGPDADALAFVDSQRGQCSSGAYGFGVQLRVS